jgi:sugar lactone lactonase YvrE
VDIGSVGAVRSEGKKHSERVLAGEKVSQPSIPTGATSAVISKSYAYSTGAVSSLSHQLEYRFNWGDGGYSAWSTSTSASHSWSAIGSYSIKAEARCITHSAVSSISTVLSVVVNPEGVSTPDIPVGPSVGIASSTYTFSTGNAVDNLGHPVEYRFDWGDGSFSAWSTSASAIHSWSVVGTYSVSAEARCQTHPALVSNSTQSGLIIDYKIITVAGNGSIGYSGDGGDALSATLKNPSGIAVDGSGNIYITDTENHCIRKVTVATGYISTVAGNGTAGFSGDSGAATSAMLSWPNGVAVDGSGNIYIADRSNYRIRKVTVATGIISTIAGNGGGGIYSGEGGPATSASLDSPYGVAVDGSGNVYIGGGCCIRKVTVATGNISTIAGNGTGGYSGDGGAATSAMLWWANSIAFDSSGNIYIADYLNYRIRKVTVSTGIITTVVGDGVQASGYTGDGISATSMQLRNASSVDIDLAGNIYISDGGIHRVFKVTTSTGIINSIVGGGATYGDGGAAISAQLSFPSGIAVDSTGNVYIVDAGNQRIRKVVVAP